MQECVRSGNSWEIPTFVEWDNWALDSAAKRASTHNNKGKLQVHVALYCSQAREA